MGDTKKGREKQARDAERRQRERELEEARDRGDEDEPDEELGDLDESLEAHEYPTTTDELIDAYGDREVETQGGSRSVADVLGPVDDETYDSADDVRTRIRELVHRE